MTDMTEDFWKLTEENKRLKEEIKRLRELLLPRIDEGYTTSYMNGNLMTTWIDR